MNGDVIDLKGDIPLLANLKRVADRAKIPRHFIRLEGRPVENDRSPQEPSS
jgi:hypothetical protein